MQKKRLLVSIGLLVKRAYGLSNKENWIENLIRADSGKNGPVLPYEPGPPVPKESGPPVGAKRRWSFFVKQRSVLVKGDGVFSHRVSFQFDFVSIVNHSIKNGIGEGRIADGFMPGRDGQLAGDHC